MGVVYSITNTVNGNIYIGSTVQKLNRRWYDHVVTLKGQRHGNRYLQRAWNKYGEDSFRLDVIERVSGYKKLLEREQHWIDKYYGEGCYNIGKAVENPMKGRTHTKKTRKQLSESNKRAWKNADYRERMDDYYSLEETIEEKSRRTKELWESQEYREKVVSAMRGVPKTEEMKESLRAGSKRRWARQEERDAIGRKRANTYDGFISPDGIVYSPVINMREFCRTHNLCRPSMSKLNKGDISDHKGWTRCEAIGGQQDG